MDSLRSFYFKNNGLEKIEDNAFLIFPKLITLDISYNNIIGKLFIFSLETKPIAPNFFDAMIPFQKFFLVLRVRC